MNLITLKSASVLLAASLGMICMGQTPTSLLGMGLHQKEGAMVPLDTPFTDEGGNAVKLGDYFGKRPVLLLPVFYRCQSGCPAIRTGLLNTIVVAEHPTGMMGYVAKGKPTRPLELGKDLEVVEISIDPRETPDLAADQKAEITNGLRDFLRNDQLARAQAQHWHFLTGSLKSIRAVTDAAGVEYYLKVRPTYDVENDVIRHPTCSVILGPNGIVSSYTLGDGFPPDQLEKALAIAAQNKAGALVDQSCPFACYLADPSARRIGKLVYQAIFVGGIITLLALGISIFRMIKNERKTSLPAGGQASGA